MADELTPSRLSESGAAIRYKLETRNLYTEFKQYPPEPDQVEQVVNSISTVLQTIAPFNSFNLKDSLLGRTITLPNTPLTDIGLQMLGKQLTNNFKQNLAQQTFPSFTPSNMFKKGRKLFEKTENFVITQNSRLQEDKKDRSKFLERFIGFTPEKNPLPVKITNSELIERTGSAQLGFLYGDGNSNGGINQNVYKPAGYGYSRISVIAPSVQIGDRNNLVANKKWFDFLNQDFYPYYSLIPTTYSEDLANKIMINVYNLAVIKKDSLNDNQEYAPSQGYVDSYFGHTTSGDKEYYLGSRFGSDRNGWVFNTDDNIDNQIVWGRDGLETRTNERVATLRGLKEDNINPNQNIFDKFSGRTGLLQYTKNLLNATEGQIIDQTRKVFKKGEEFTGFNGSPLWRSNNSRYAIHNNFNDDVGIRQHSMLDQYNRFAKAIRFDGNVAYGGNENSVVYKTVLPRIHPSLNEDTGLIDNKNLVFSIENLAVGVVGDENHAYVDDNYGTEIPLAEMGPFGGRLMWFPPYGLDLNETANAKYDSTVMVGRNEPMYTYINSERSANLSFILLMDHPPQVKNYRNGNHKDIAEFFAFGGDPYEPVSTIDQIQRLEFEIQIKIKELGDIGKVVIPQTSLPGELAIVFPNDMPEKDKSGQITSIMNDMYNTYHYEIDERVESSDGTSFGLNEEIYNTTGLTIGINPNTVDTVVPYVDQYKTPYSAGQSDLDDALYTLFNKPEDRKFFKLIVTGSASKLYNGPDEQEYNEELGGRRADATVYFIEQRITALFGKTALKDITIELGAGDGSTGSEDSDSVSGGTVAGIPLKATKLERKATIKFDKSGEQGGTKERSLTPEEQERIITLKITISRLQKQLKTLLLQQEASVYIEKKSSDLTDQDDGILNGYQAIIDGKFYPVFHSQTPEDFHRRLTFLHQCTRQGKAIEHAPMKDGNNIPRAKNSVFGKQPICILRIADFMYTKVIIETITFDYVDATWDVNPEGFGMQPMVAKINVQMKLIGGQSLKGPIDALQNAVSYNYYANSTYSDKGIYILPSYTAAAQEAFNKGVSINSDEFQSSEIAKAFNSKKSANLKAVSAILKEKEDATK